MDGGMGTLLQERGLKAGEYPEIWNLTHPDVVSSIHKAYLEAGSDIITTNTFGANILKFDKNECKDIVFAAVENAKSACFKKDQFIALDIGPTGKLLEPLGNLEFERAVDIFAQTISLGAKAGADLIIIETMNDSYEMKAAVLAAKENCDLPIFATNAYDKTGKLMTGASPNAMVALLEGLNVDALGINCSLGPEEMLGVVDELLRYASIPVIVNPNAGLPRVEGDKTIYDVGPESFTKSMIKIASMGARILGGCCGTTPEHIRRMVSVLKNTAPRPLYDKNITLVSSYTHAIEFGKRPILIGGGINPTGKKRLEQALIAEDMGYIVKQAISQEASSADLLDVNTGVPSVDESKLLKMSVKEIQAVSSLPLSLDSSDPLALQKALRVYNGKPMINSVNGKKEVMAEIFPLAKKYGGLIVGLLLDENGIPETPGGRIKIAEKIYDTATLYGIAKKDIILDPLVMTISSEKSASRIVLETVKRIKEDLKGRTLLGISNISFGLPERDFLNASFFLMAMDMGLDAAIINTGSLRMMEIFYSFLALNELDENCASYIDFATGERVRKRNELLKGNAVLSNTLPKPDFINNTKSKRASTKKDSDLNNAIKKGLKDEARSLTRKLLSQGEKPLSIIDNKLIPALNEIGKDFEKNNIFLPQLLMSSEAAREVFSILKEYMEAHGEKQDKKGKFVIATVKGDIHDIGKNIVKAILENYDFEVFDLGKDVPAKTIVDKVIKEHAPIVGLSALMTTTVPNMEETIKALRKDAPWCKIIVGGAVLTKKYADMIGADFYAKDAMETVRLAEQILKENKCC